MTLLEAMQIRNERRERGQAAWDVLVLRGGIWPEAESATLPPQMLDGMGEYLAADVQSILADALSSAPVDRAWPWVAHAAFLYSGDRRINATLSNSEDNADKLVERIGNQAGKLVSSLIALNSIGLRGPDVVGKPHADKAWRLLSDLQNQFAGPQSTGREYVQFVEKLAFIEDTCKSRRSTVAKSRKRGASDPHLALLVWHLAAFWRRAANREPSAADPGHIDRDGPFVRLVNGCLRMAHGPTATSAQVDRAIRTPPYFALQKD